jgi:hypothetical protein
VNMRVPSAAHFDMCYNSQRRMTRVYHMNAWYLLVNVILVMMLLPGGIFMFARYLRKMKQDES